MDEVPGATRAAALVKNKNSAVRKLVKSQFDLEPSLGKVTPRARRNSLPHGVLTWM